MRTAIIVARLVVWVVALIVIVASLSVLGVFILFEDRAERYTAGERPPLFYAALGDGRLEAYPRVFGVAHNSGDSIHATLRALEHGADVIEIDVIEYNGVLYAAHNPPLPRIGGQVFRGPRLADAWAVAGQAEVIKLDLKQSSPEFVSRVAAFLNHRADQQVIVTSRDPAALRLLADEAPHAYRMLSIASAERLAALREDDELLTIIDGVTIDHRLLDDDSAGWLRERDLTVLAWTVNDIERVNELVALGVDAITTDNLAILELLGGHQQGEALLERARSRRGAAN